MLRKLIYSIGLQSLGLLATFITIFLISKNFGLSAQGDFALIKSWIDLMVTIGSLGFAQGCIFAINRLKLSAEVFKYYFIRYSIIVTILLIIINFVFFHGTSQEQIISPLIKIMLGISGGSLVFYGLLRGILLTINDGAIFSFITAIPALILMLSVVLNVFFDSSNLYIYFCYLISTIFACVIIYYLTPKPKNGILPLKKIFFQGNYIFLQSLFVALLPYGSYWLMNGFGYAKSEIGLFNLSVYALQLFSLPIVMTAPIFLSRWTKIENLLVIKKDIKILFLYSIVVIFFGFCSFFTLPKLLIVLNLSFYNLNLFYIMIFVSVPYVLNYILQNYILARGYFRLLATFALFKTLIALFLIIIGIVYIGKDIEIIGVSWLVSEVFTLLIFSYIIISPFKSKNKI